MSEPLQIIRKIAHKITDLRQGYTTNFEDYANTCVEDETYEVDTHNIITACNISIADCQFIVSKTVERDTFEIYADDQETGEYARIVVNSSGNIDTIYKFIENAELNIKFYGVKLSSIGKFYKPNNESKVNQLSNIDKESLWYLLLLLEKRHILKLSTDENVIDKLSDVLIEWNCTKI